MIDTELEGLLVESLQRLTEHLEIPPIGVR